MLLLIGMTRKDLFTMTRYKRHRVIRGKCLKQTGTTGDPTQLSAPSNRIQFQDHPIAKINPRYYMSTITTAVITDL